MKQWERVYRHLQDKGTITSLEAFTDYGITRLSDVVYQLRHKGIVVESEMIDVPNRYGEECRVARYSLGA